MRHPIVVAASVALLSWATGASASLASWQVCKNAAGQPDGGVLVSHAKAKGYGYDWIVSARKHDPRRYYVEIHDVVRIVESGIVYLGHTVSATSLPYAPLSYVRCEPK